jgi:NDP-sugar pyrophosphorylase family protein
VLSHLAGDRFASPIAEYVFDIGTLEKYAQAQREWPGFVGN